MLRSTVKDTRNMVLILVSDLWRREKEWTRRWGKWEKQVRLRRGVDKDGQKIKIQY